MAETKEDLNIEQLESEEVLPLYFDNALIKPDFKLFRINTPSGRLYWKHNEVSDLAPEIYSGTGSITKEIPLSKQLEKYRAAKGIDAANHELYMYTLYGSFTHSLIAEFVILGRLDLHDLPERLKQYFYTQNFAVSEEEFYTMAKEVKKDMIGFAFWAQQRKVQFAFIEFPVVSSVDGLATQIDIGCFMDDYYSEKKIKKDGEIGKTNERKTRRVFSLINYKSGNIYPNNQYQMLAELNMFRESYPAFTEMPIRIMNLAIKNWRSAKWDNRSTPYTLKDWTDEVDLDRYDHYLGLAKRSREDRIQSKVTVLEGKMTLGADPMNHIVTKTFQQIIMDGSWITFQKSNAALPLSTI